MECVVLSPLDLCTYTLDFITGKVRADAINGRCQLIGGTVPYAATLKSWMADSSTAGDRPWTKYGNNRQVYAPCNESRFFSTFSTFFFLPVYYLSEGFKAHLEPCHGWPPFRLLGSNSYESYSRYEYRAYVLATAILKKGSNLNRECYLIPHSPILYININ